MNTIDQEISNLKAKALLAEYDNRKSINSSYSKRAFARDLKISHSLLSFILNRKRPMANSMALQLLDNPQLSDRTKDILAIGIKQRSQARTKISLEQFEVISDWIHYALIELLETEDFIWDAGFISKRLNITVQKAEQVMQRLIDVKLVAISDDGKFHQTQTKIVVENKQSNQAAKNYNRGLLKKASDVMDECEFHQRDLSSTVFTLDPSYISYAVEKIRAFRRELTDELENLGKRREVYALSFQLFPLTKLEKK